jgi:hypothetical protein
MGPDIGAGMGPRLLRCCTVKVIVVPALALAWGLPHIWNLCSTSQGTESGGQRAERKSTDTFKPIHHRCWITNRLHKGAHLTDMLIYDMHVPLPKEVSKLLHMLDRQFDKMVCRLNWVNNFVCRNYAEQPEKELAAVYQQHKAPMTHPLIFREKNKI